MQTVLRRTVYALILLCSACAASAQVATGLYAYGSFDVPGFESIDRGSLNVHFTVPIVNKQGRGLNFQYNIDYEGLVWSPTSAAWTPDSTWGFHGQLGENLQGYVSYVQKSFSCPEEGDGGLIHVPGTLSYKYAYRDAFGVSHSFNYSTLACTGYDTVTTGDGSTSDGSGYSFNGVSVIAKNGTIINAPVNNAQGAGTITDTNGNEVTNNGSGVFIDTAGVTALTITGSGTPSSPKVFTYKTTTATATVSISYKTYTVQTDFGCSGVAEYNQSAALVDRITFSDSSYYQFEYEDTPGSSTNVTGRLASVTLPQGGVISYQYTGGSNGISCTDGTPTGITRTTADSIRTYVRSLITSATSHTNIEDGLGYNSAFDFVTSGSPTQFYETLRSQYEGAATGIPVLARNTCYNGATSPCTTTALTLPVTQIDTYETPNGIQTHGSTLTINTLGMASERDVYDFGTSPVRGSLLSKEYWSYDGPYGAFVSADQIYDPSNNEARLIKYGYDGSSPTPSSGVPQHVAATGPRANLTSETLYANAGTSYALSATYEDTGSVLSSTTPSGITTLGYDSTFVYNTSVTPPTPSSGVALGSSASFDTAYTGLPLSTTDPNLQKTKITSYNSMLQPIEEQFPDGGQTTWTYTPTSVTTTTLQTAAGVSASNEVQYDGYGRVSRTATVNGQSTNPYYQQDTCYDGNGNVSFVSYPYQGNGLGASKLCSGSGDVYSYDVLGRLTKITRANGESLSYAYNGRATESTDENGVQIITQVDGLGRPTIVCEISSGTGLVNSGSPASCGTDISGTGFTTTYAYALATGTTTVTQGAQTRTFKTDWLGRTTSVTEPESGTTTYSYAYNSTGLVVTRTRPKANQTSTSVTTTTTTQYDTVGRPISITYSDGTPTKTYAYDAGAGSNWTDFSATNLKGRLSLASVSGAASAFSYDPVGRVNYLDSCLPSGPCGTVADNRLQHYTYDLAGDLLTSTDGSTVTSTYTVTPAFELKSLTSSLSNAENPAELVSSIGNGPNGPISYNLGNGLSAAYRYDTLGRFNGTWVCSGSASAYCSGGTQIYGNTVDGRVGIQIKGVSDTVLNAGVGFGYDQFNRLTSRTVNNGTAQNFTYTYDRWGNRWSQTVTSGSGPQPSYSFNTSTNQITSSGFAYDAAGNLTNDGTHTYTYDAEGNITAVDGGSTATYVYDALNHRIRTVANGATTEFVFNQNGQRASVWNGSTKNVLRDQYYWGSQPVAFAAAGAVHFQHQDYLGTERIRTTYNGGVEGSYISLPFGDGYTASGSDLDPYHYAQLDYDSETNTSHAQYREYSSTQGRWMRPDPYSGSYIFTNPQSFNRYAYVLNNPMGFIDPTGYVLCDFGPDGFGGENVKDEDSDANCTNSGGTPVNVDATVTVNADGSGSLEVDYTDLTGTIVLDYETFGPNNGPTRSQCLGQALKSDGNGVSLALDVAGIGAGFLPGGGLVTGSAQAATVAFGAQVGLTAASTGVSIAYKSGPGIVAGILGGQVALTAKSVETAGEETALLFGKSIPIVGVAVSTGALLYDGYQTYKAYSGCLAGVHE